MTYGLFLFLVRQHIDKVFISPKLCYSIFYDTIEFLSDIEEIYEHSQRTFHGAISTVRHTTDRHRHYTNRHPSRALPVAAGLWLASVTGRLSSHKAKVLRVSRSAPSPILPAAVSNADRAVIDCYTDRDTGTYCIAMFFHNGYYN